MYPVGRNGMHRYNNQDHSMLTAMLSVENIFGADHDIWSVNVEAEYHEEKSRTCVDPVRNAHRFTQVRGWSAEVAGAVADAPPRDEDELLGRDAPA